MTTAPLETTIIECLALVTSQKIRHSAMLEAGQLVGIVTIGNIGKAIISELEVAIRDLEGYITGRI